MTALLSTLAPVPRVHDRFNTTACLAIGAAISAYCIAEPAPLLAAFSLPILALGWWYARGGTPPLLPRLVINILVLVAIARAFLFVTGSTEPVVSHLSEFLVLIQLVKLFDRRTTRDEAQLLSLSLFIVIGALLTSNTLGVGVLLLVYTPLATAGVMLLQIRAGLTRASAADPRRIPNRESTVFAADLARPGPRARAARLHFLGLVTGAIVMAFVFAFVVFLLTPRGLGQDRFGRLGQTPAASTIGFNDEVRLGSSGFLSQDTTPVMDVMVSDEDGQRIGSEAQALHLRGAVLDAYDPRQRNWRSTNFRANDNSYRMDPGERQALAPPASGRLVQRLDVSVREGFSTRRSYLFSLWAPTAIEFPTAESITRPGRDYTLRRSGDSSSRLRYSIWSDLEGAGPNGPPFRRRHFGPEFEERAAPFQSGPIRELAVRLLGDRDLPTDPAQRDAAETRAAANVMLTYLRQNYEYTLDLIAPGEDQDPIEMFLFETRRGHCEYFASALVAMCHSVGIDARLVTGYLATEYNPVTGQYLVRQSNAHAWVEVALDGEYDGRWMTMDPSPPAALDLIHRSGNGLLARVRQLYEAIDFAWNDTVVSFDDRRRSQFLGRFFGGEGESGPIEAGRRFAQRLRSMLPFSAATSAASQQLVLLGLIMVLGAGVLMLPALLRRLRGRTARGAAGAARADPQLRRLLAGAVFYDRALDLLDRAGLGKPASRPPLAHAEALGATRPDLAGTFGAIAALYYRPRFARIALTEPEAAEADRLLGRLAAELQAAGPGADQAGPVRQRR